MPLKRQRCFDEQACCQKGSTDNLCSGVGSSKTFFIIAPPCSAIVHACVHKNMFRFKNFQPRNEFLSRCACARDCNSHDTIRRRKNQPFNACIASFPMKFAL